MEATFETSVPTVRNKIALIEAIELFIIGSAFSALVALGNFMSSDPDFVGLIVFILLTHGVLLGSWAIYNAYIRVARAGGRTLDVLIWVFASLLTGSYTFWAWTILDVNRFIMSKLLYRGEAPVEYAWSWRSKQIRKLWEQAQKASSI